MDNIQYILFRSDAHSGALRGLQHPEQLIELDGRLTPLIQTSTQKAIWDEVYIPGLEYFAGIIGNAPVTVIDGGDLIQGVTHIDDVVSVIMRTQFEIALKTFEPIYKLIPNIVQTILLIGTRAHALDEEGTVETVMRDRLRAGGHYAEVVWHGMINIAGIMIDAAHVGANVGKGMNRGNAVLNYLKQSMYEEWNILGQRPPELYARFHFHDWALATWTMISRGEVLTSQAMVCPPLCSMNGYARGATRSNPYVHIGMMLARVTDGRVDIIPFVKVYDVRQHIGESRGTIGFHYQGSPRS